MPNAILLLLFRSCGTCR